MCGDIAGKSLMHGFRNSVQAADSFGSNGENGLPFLFSRVRCGDNSRWDSYLEPTPCHNSVAPARDFLEADSVC